MLTFSMGSSPCSLPAEAASLNQSTPNIPHPKGAMTSNLWKHLSVPRRVIAYSPFKHFLLKPVHCLSYSVYPSLSPNLHLYNSSPTPGQVMETCQGSRLLWKLLCYLPSAWLYRWPPRAAFRAFTVFTVYQPVKQPAWSNSFMSPRLAEHQKTKMSF